MKARIVSIAAALFLSASSLLAGAQAADPVTPPAGATQVPPPPAAADPKVGPQYIIGPGDTLQIYVWLHPDLSVPSVPVRPDGKISIPLVEDLVAAGKAPSALGRDIEARLKEYVRTPQVNVIVSGAANVFNQVTVIGQVKSPQALPYRAGMTVLDAILGVGGLSEFAAGNRATLVRKGADGKEMRQKLRIDDLVRKGKVSANVELRAGDVIIVPESIF